MDFSLSPDHESYRTRIRAFEADRLLSLESTLRPTIEAHLAASLRLDELIEDRLGSLDKRQFERMLRGIFEEDEWILIVIGGALGGAIGAAQGLLARTLEL